MTGFLDRLAAHAQGTAPVLRLRPRARFEEVRPDPTRPAAPAEDEFLAQPPPPAPDEDAAETRPAAPDDGPAPRPAAAHRTPGAVRESPPSGDAVEARDRPAPAGHRARPPDPREPPDPPDPGEPADLAADPREPADPAADPGEPADLAGPVRAPRHTGVPAGANARTAIRGDDAPRPGHSNLRAVPPRRREPVAVPAPGTGYPRPATDPPAQPVPIAARARLRPVEPHPRGHQADRAEATPDPADLRWPATAEVGRRLAAALRDAGLRTPAAGPEAPDVRWPEDAFPGRADLAGRIVAGRHATAEAGRDVHLHVHVDRVEVVHPAPPATRTVRRVEPPAARRPGSSVDHDAYLARRREDRR